MANRGEVPQATKAVHLIQLALEIDEDTVWDAIAQKRDTKNVKFVSHKKMWN